MRNILENINIFSVLK